MPVTTSQTPFFPGREVLLFWAVALAQLIPVWALPYLPTQDGPAHLNSAIILKDFATPGTRYHEFFELRLEPIPNWTAQLLLAGLLGAFSPLVAEKVFVSGCMLLQAGALRYFYGSFGASARPLALVGLLFVFNRCFWLGFYNFLLSLTLCWFILSYWLRRCERPNIRTAAALTLLLTAAFFTHLVGFLLAVAALFWFTLTFPRRSWRALGQVALASTPGILLMVDYFDQSGFFGPGGSGRLRDHFSHLVHNPWSALHLARDLSSLDDELFAHHAGESIPMGLIVLALFTVLIVLTLLPREAGNQTRNSLFPRRCVAMLALACFALYLLLPEHLDMAHGGFLKTRLSVVAPLLLLPCLREPSSWAGVAVLRAVLVLAIAVNLVLVVQRCAEDNQAIAEYTAARQVVGSGHVLFIIQPIHGAGRTRHREIADPLLHASNYYCLGTGNLNLDNYQASTHHFPLRFRAGVTRGRDHLDSYPRLDDIEIILVWKRGPDPTLPATFQPVFRHGWLRVWARR